MTGRVPLELWTGLGGRGHAVCHDRAGVSADRPAGSWQGGYRDLLRRRQAVFGYPNDEAKRG
jgi:hypothetical protein